MDNSPRYGATFDLNAMNSARPERARGAIPEILATFTPPANGKSFVFKPTIEFKSHSQHDL